MTPFIQAKYAIVHGNRSITADTALRLGADFDVSPETWRKLQSELDLRVAARAIGDDISRIVQKLESASSRRIDK